MYLIYIYNSFYLIYIYHYDYDPLIRFIQMRRNNEFNLRIRLQLGFSDYVQISRDTEVNLHW